MGQAGQDAGTTIGGPCRPMRRLRDPYLSGERSVTMPVGTSGRSVQDGSGGSGDRSPDSFALQ